MNSKCNIFYTEEGKKIQNTNVLKVEEFLRGVGVVNYIRMVVKLRNWITNLCKMFHMKIHIH